MTDLPQPPLKISAEVTEALAQKLPVEARMPADIAGTRGATPWFLSELDTATQGRTRQANLALLENNAHLAAQIATALVEDKN
jgi:pseudouridine-5'-phosphate glycosidase